MNGSFETTRERNSSLEIGVTHGCPAHFHSHVELMSVRRGAVGAAINGISYRLTAGTAVIADSYAVHAWSPDPDSECVYVIAPAQYLIGYTAAMRGRTFAVPVLCEDAAVTRINSLIDFLRQSRKDSLAARGLVTAILGEFVENLPMRERNTSDQTHLIREVLLYISENFAEPLSLESLSRKYGYTPSHFSRIFNAYTGENLSAYIGALRANEAAALLISGRNISEAAEKAGFRSMRSFYRIFYDVIGVTPREYTKSASSAKSSPAR